MIESVNVLAWDGYPLTATHFIPSVSNGKVLLMVNAIGQTKKLYSSFCTFFAEAGFHVYSFDFRGTGESKSRKARELNCDLHDWAVLDLDAMISYISSVHPNCRLNISVHGRSGLLCGISRLSKRAESIVFIACPSPFYSHTGIVHAVNRFVFAQLLIPFFNFFIGYFPASWFGLGEDLPEHVAEHWLRWAKAPHGVYEGSDEIRKNFASLEQKSLVVNFADDRLVTRRSSEKFQEIFPRLRHEVWTFSPEQLVQKNVGHLGFFKKSMKALLWNDVAQWVIQRGNVQKSKAA